MNYDPRPELITAARQFYQQGWMMGTAGNLSAKLPDNSFWITASGKSKGKLTESDFVRVNLDGKVIELPDNNNRPSAETSIHQTIYQCFPNAHACYHVHSVEANLISRCVKGDNLVLPAIEMLKGLGIWEENPNVVMPTFKNHLDVPRIAQEIRDRFSRKPPDVPALLIIDHGVTVWADTTEQAANYLEIAEYLFRYLIAARQVE
ncbi:methylthioribulose-1-phosphate dehydratase [Rippkaea orientalis PCC 8801]|uniref:Methylthioribulose-1-phosphate dehydratase n=1 Tax=Rippkaea orientalis (strain PCC 8801 / RF-1) TaxID=41431 RepID=B7JUT6_RIPO1|nr:methylthioribulose 1-phosphate dehydratase [Rippkaea orientalis]ACK65630.1 methylthioribulose-1-phosphate dehydratase [Rippkaea orientalis PCC 8801]